MNKKEDCQIDCNNCLGFDLCEETEKIKNKKEIYI
jgi:hypothetical protein